MKKSGWLCFILLWAVLGSINVFAQQAPKAATKSAPAVTLASVLDQQFSIVEKEFVSAAEAMPEDKYSFAPTNGEFKGVRTFAEQVKHVAASNYLFARAILGEEPPKEGNEDGPDSVKTKEQILKYLRDSFALSHRAFATINAENALTPVKHPLGKTFTTPMALASITCWHPFDHYGQMVEYLRMNGIVPPASRK